MLIGIIASRGIEPTVGFIPTQPLSDAGQTIEPSVSLPTAISTIPAPTAAPDPDDEPPALLPCFQGFAVSPPTADHPLVDFPERMLAHSERFVAPMIVAPAARNRFAIVESRTTSVSCSASEPAVAGRPIASILSLIKIGTPESGPSFSLNSRSLVSAKTELRRYPL